jgi:hypothetical protein
LKEKKGKEKGGKADMSITLLIYMTLALHTMKR